MHRPLTPVTPHRPRRLPRAAGILTAVLALTGALLGPTAGARAATDPPPRAAANPGPAFRVHNGPNGESDVNACSYAVLPGHMRCNARVRTDPAAHQLAAALAGNSLTPPATGTSGPYPPASLQAAYATPSATGGQAATVAIVDAYDDPTAETDLATYRNNYHLPSCTTANGCFRKVDQNGGTLYPVPDGVPGDNGWTLEISLDLDMVSAICPNCHILLVEASSSSSADLYPAVDTAVSLGASVVSNSYGGPEYGYETTDDAHFNHPGVPIVASAGDSGYGVQYPAASPYVTAVGGTSLLNQPSGSRNWTESVWYSPPSGGYPASGTGSGCSAYEAKPLWQQDPGCANRTVADVSAVADPQTGVIVYDSYPIQQSNNTPPIPPGYTVLGGTSASAPIIAGLYALAGKPPGDAVTASFPYDNPAALNDVTTGHNGSCSPAYLCTAQAGYDGPTGLGTPVGTPAFTAPVPTGVVAQPGPAKASVFWNPVPGVAGHPVTGYTVTPYLNGIAQASQSVSAPATSATVGNLTDGKSYTFTVAAVSVAGTGPGSAPSNAVVPTGPTPGYSAVAPIRVLDTRPGSHPGSQIGRLQPNQDYLVNLDQSALPPGFTAYAFNVTAIGPSGPGNLRIGPAGGCSGGVARTATPPTSLVNYQGSHDVANFVVVPSGGCNAGTFDLYSDGAATDVAIDAVGYYNGGFAKVSPTRLADTRSGLGGTTGPLPGGATQRFQIAGAHDGSGAVPVPSGAKAVALSVTAIDPSGVGYLQVTPDGAPAGNSSNVNYIAGVDKAAFVVVNLPSDGMIDVHTANASVNVAIDVFGYYDAGSTLATQPPQRVLDTRAGPSYGPQQGLPDPLAAGQTYNFQVGGQAGVPANAEAVLVSLTSIHASGSTGVGNLQLFPAGAPNHASNLNYVGPGDDVANFAIVKLGTNGQLSLLSAGSPIDAAVDVLGYVPAGG